MSAVNQMRFLLLQARLISDPMADHERLCFARALDVPSDQVVAHDMLAGMPDGRALDAADVLLVGGSGDFSVLDKEPFIRAFLLFLEREVLDRGFPTFASCFGFQGLVLAGGGEVIHDPEHAEVGTYDVRVTEAGRRDPLLSPLAPTFKAQLGHKDRASRLPSGVTHLASTPLAPYQALRVDGMPVVATQFHPELTRDDNIMRYLRYQEIYGGVRDPEEDPILKRMSHSEGATALLRRFVEQLADSHGRSTSDDVCSYAS